MKIIAHNKKNIIMKNIIRILIIFTLTIISCKAQTVSLETLAKCQQENPPFPCPENYNYVKDINNLLNKYVGTWKGNLNGKVYEFNFIKKENVGDDIKDDRLIGRFKVINSIGTVLYNTLNETNDNETFFLGRNFQPDLEAYMVYFVGNSACVEYGDVYLRIYPSTPNQMTVYFHPDNDISVEGSCPPNFVPTIPYKTTIHLTKQ
ncbi:MAG: hypothetical protein K0R36_3569 [Chryseobacterium sp.]|jgi:hypothetical protein|nr:hypothetical protein [Chryseobacterium sp.]